MDETDYHGLQVLYEPDESTDIDLDIVAVSGLHGHPRQSWTSASSGPNPCMWLQDLLPKHMPNARIMVFDYNSGSAGEDALLSTQGLTYAATKLLEALVEERSDWQGEGTWPITFIAHDLGGIVVKKALIMATENSTFRSISTSAHRLIFFGTLHRTKDESSWEDLVYNIFLATRSSKSNSQGLPSRIRAFAKVLPQITAGFNSLPAKYSLVNICQGDNQGSRSGGEPVVVKRYSSTTGLVYDHNIERHRKHQDICYFDRTDKQFMTVLKTIKPDCDADYIECLSTFLLLSPAFSIPSEIQGGSGGVEDYQELKKWLTDDQSTAIYLQGQPGVGKSVFSTNLLRTLRMKNTEGVLVAYFSFNDQDERRTSSTALLSSLICQILNQDPQRFPRIRDLYLALKERSIWTFEALWILFHSILAARNSGSIICIVNKIHNCDLSRTRFLSRLVEHRRAEGISSSLKVVVIREPRQDIKESMKTCRYVQLSGEPCFKRSLKPRVDQFIAELIEENPFMLDLEADLKEKLYKCESFLQLSVTLDTLMERTHKCLFPKKAIQSELQALPYDISNHIIIKTQNLPAWARKALDWIMHAQRPMKIQELAAVIALVEDDESMRLDNDELPLDLSAGMRQVYGPLLTIENDEVYWRHQQIKDCFSKAIAEEGRKNDGTERESPNGHRTRHLDHWSITCILLKYLCSKDFIDPVVRALRKDTWIQPRGPLFDMTAYAVQFWPEHYRKAKEQKAKNERSYTKAMLEYLQNRRLIQVWWDLKSRLSNIGHPSVWCVTELLPLAAHLGFVDVVDVCLGARARKGSTFASRETAIALACWVGHVDIVTKLFDDGFDKKTANNAHYLTPALIKASDQGHDEIVDFLIGHIPKPTDHYVWDPVLLCRAAEIGYETLVKRFTAAGAPVDVPHRGTAPLQLAAKNGHVSIAKHLLSLGANVNSAAAEDRYKPIMHAAHKGYTTVVELLIEYKVEVRQSNGDGQTALHLAVQHGHLDITSLLLELAPDLAAKNRKGQTALHLASLNGHAGIIERLVPNSGVDTLDGNGDTSLKLASKNGHVPAVKVLLESGAKVDLTGSDHHTALHCAAINGHETIAEIILRRGNAVKLRFADIVDVFQEAAKRGFFRVCELCLPLVHEEMSGSDDREKQKALLHAAHNGNKEVVKLLLDKGTDIETEDDNGWTPLVVAALAGRCQVVQLLLAQKANPFYKNFVGETLVSQLASLPQIDAVDGYVDTVRALLKAGIAIDDVNNTRCSALHHAVRMRNLKIAQELLSSCADPNLRNNWLETPLHYAAKNGKEFAELLLKYKANQKDCEDKTWSAFHNAAQYGNVDVMEVLWKAVPVVIGRRCGPGMTSLHLAACDLRSTKWLLDHDAELNAKDDSGKTALITAAQFGSGEVVSILLSHNADPQLRDNCEQTALHRIAHAGFISIGQSLLEKDISIINYQDYRQQSALHVAVLVGKKKFARMLLSWQPHININLQDEIGNTPLLTLASSVRGKKKDIAKLLIESGANTELRNKVGQTALSIAVTNGNEDLWKLLLDRPNGSNIDSGGGSHPTALHIAAEQGEIRAVEQLVNRGANVNATGGLFHTALQAAAASGFDDVVEYLLEKGADASLTGGLFSNALSAAVYSGTFSLVPKLNDRGVAMDAKDDQGRTALHLAAWRGSWDVIEWLKNKGSDLGVKDHQGRTILHHAAMGRNPGLVERLLNDNDTRHLIVEDIDGWTPLHWACRSMNNEEVVRLLKGTTGFRQPTQDGWTPENISIFHNARNLLPIMASAFADSNQSGTTDNLGADRTLPPARNWRSGYDHWRVVCDGCGTFIYGLRWRCMDCSKFEHCFKCFWTRDATHPKHTFEKLGEGPERNPEFEAEI